MNSKFPSGYTDDDLILIDRFEFGKEQRAARTKSLVDASNARILVLDGATGTALQGLDLSVEDFGGAEFEGCNEDLVLLRPEIVRHLHQTYFEAGCDIVETNTFGATALVLAEYDLEAFA